MVIHLQMSKKQNGKLKEVYYVMKNKLSVYSKSPCFVSGLMFFSKRTLWWLEVTLVFGNLVYLCNNKSSFDQYARTVFLY